MVSAWGLGRYTPIGLDVGCAGVRAAQFVRRAGRWWLHRATIIEDAPPADGPAANLDNLDTVRIRRILDLHDYRGTQVVAALDPPEVALRQVSVPAEAAAASESARMTAVQHELQERLGVNLDGQEVRAWSLPPSRRSQNEVMAVLASTERITTTLERLEQGGLCCVGLNVGAWALAAGCRAEHPAEPSDLWGILEIGHLASHLVVVLGPTPLLHRMVPVAGAQFTEHVARRLKLEPPMAERLRREHGLQPTDRALRQQPAEGGPLQEQVIASLIHAAVRRDLRQLAEEVEKSFSYAIDAYPNANPVHLVLAGSGAQWRGLDVALGDLLGIKVRLADPLAPWPKSDGCTPGNGGSSSLVRALGLVVPEASAG